MKKVITLFFVIICLFARSQDTIKKLIKDTCWKTTGFVGLNFSQTALSNWQGGGQDNIAFTGLVNYEANFKKGHHEWNNKLDIQFGIIMQGQSKFWKKNVDQILAVSQYNILAFKKYWFYSAMADFRSQLSPGYNYLGDTARKMISDWAAPAYIQLALGLDFKPAEYFSATISPLAGRVTVVNNQIFANNGDFGVTKAVLDGSGNIITPGKKIRYQFGGRFTLKFKKDIVKNVNLDTYADFFTSYFNNPGLNTVVVWNTLITLKINKFLSASISTKFIYDNDITIKYDWNKDGKYDNKNDIYGPRVQLLSNFGIGIGYKF
ncbi:MAG TPA: DUF3078 domain-containing protein [Bacteroidia bacterium]|jgi:hypothetical protein|nr:DUF3078 domain-containing protein [Bacteroidia bacterium]